jgi:type VI secretion system secreted protein Hcp
MAFDAFLKIDGIPGDSADAKHRDEIEVLSYSWGVESPNAGSPSGGGGGGSGKVVPGDFRFTMQVGRASPLLFLSCANGKHIKVVNLTLIRAGVTQQEFVEVEMTDVQVAALQDGGETSAMPVDEVALVYGQLQFTYVPQDAKGGAGTPVTAGWDFRSNSST